MKKEKTQETAQGQEEEAGKKEEMEFAYELRVPKERIAVLIGVKGDVKKRIEDETNSKIHIDSQEGDVRITGNDSLGLFNAREIIKAIGRGFSPDTAMLVLKSDYAFELLGISDYVGDSKNAAQRLKGRVIGKEGKARNYIEKITETNISVYGKTIGIIGEVENVMIARRAIEELLAGANHDSVYKWMERKKKELERNRMVGLDKIELKESFKEKREKE